ncbi:hypothetical protein [Loktanella sp. DSM 29012]|uniref:hypothetical protein n=1 Tax=Loktanella sp. DSM 29012 TaxID=1881056 RepID=UPI00115FB961|nr:hypothetical protein [Loktanella sp. DSM 29012]
MRYNSGDRAAVEIDLTDLSYDAESLAFPLMDGVMQYAGQLLSNDPGAASQEEVPTLAQAQPAQDRTSQRVRIAVADWQAPLDDRALNIVEVGLDDAGRQFYDIDLPLRSTVMLQSQDYPFCAELLAGARFADADAGMVVHDFAPACRAVAVTGPAGDTLRAQDCSGEGAELTCVLADGVDRLRVTSAIWGDFDVALGDAAEVVLAPAPELRPAITIDMNMVDGAATCGLADAQLQVTGYCAADACNDVAPFDITGQGATLSEAGWTQAVFPDAVRLAVQRPGEDLLTQVAPLGPSLTDVAADMVRQLPDLRLPLALSDGVTATAGTVVQLFGDNACQTRSDSIALDALDDAAPVLACGSLQLQSDTGTALSRCAALQVSEDRLSVAPDTPLSTCTQPPVLVHLAQHDSMNGDLGFAIVDALLDAATSQSEAEVCANVSYTMSRNELRETLVSGQSLYLNANAVQDANFASLDFLTPRSELLRDFIWIWRQAGRDMSGLVIIAQGDDVYVDDLTSSPEALAWEVLGIPVHLLDTSGAVDCDMFTQRLLFDSCTSVTAGSVSADLQSLLSDLTK